VKPVILSPSARLDLLEIDLQTFELFGYEQSIATEDEFKRVFAMLSANPELGQVREDLSTPGKAFRMWIVLRRFVVVYEDTPESLRIIRIVDGARDLPSLLEPE
jgi:toxin ParE1/3/4